MTRRQSARVLERQMRPPRRGAIPGIRPPGVPLWAALAPAREGEPVPERPEPGQATSLLPPPPAPPVERRRPVVKPNGLDVQRQLEGLTPLTKQRHEPS